jgi:hypothetical protein
MSFQPARQPARSFAQHRSSFINRFIPKPAVGTVNLLHYWRGARLALRRHERCTIVFHAAAFALVLAT